MFDRTRVHGKLRQAAVALVSALAVCFALVAAGPAQAAAPAAAQPAPTVQQARAAASAEARAEGRPVPVSALATATSSTVADPDGGFTTTSQLASGRSGDDGALASAQVASGCPFDKHGYGTADSGVGFSRSGPCAGVNRTFLDMSLAGLSSADDVLSSSFSITSDYSAEPDCSAADAEQVSLDWTGPIGTATDWRHQPGPMSSASVPKPMATEAVTADGDSSGTTCGGVLAVFPITSEVASFVGRGDSDVTFGMYGADKPSGGFERFEVSTAELVTTYDIAPNAPANPAASPTPVLSGGTAAPCGSTANPGFASFENIGGIKAVALSALLTSPISGTQLQAVFTVNDLTAGTSTTVTGIGVVVSGDTASVTTPALVDGHEYSWSVTATDGLLTSVPSATCAFIEDQTPPTNPAVSSTDFPPSSSGQTGLSTGQTGTLTVSASDPSPASGGPASGLTGFEYSFDEPLAVDGNPFVAASASGTATITYGTSDFGTHTLFVQAVDGAGNVSRQTEYSFFVPQAPGAPVPGDVNGDHVPDLVTMNGSGDLVEFPGGSESGTGPVLLSAPADSPQGDSWADYDFAHYGSFHQGPVDDLVAYSTTSHILYLYGNDGSTIGGNFAGTSAVSDVDKEAACQATSTGSCTGYDSTDWNELTSITASGDLLAGDPVPGVDDDQPGLLTVENGSLWFYQGSGPFFDTVFPLGGSGWNGFTLLNPGTVGGAPVIWALDDATGVVYQYPITFDPAGDPVDLGAPTSGSGTALTVPAGDGQTGGLPSAQYSGIYSVDLHGDGEPDLVAITTSGDVIDWPGAAATGAGLATFGTPVTLGNVNSGS